jgi:hypothetical protein
MPEGSIPIFQHSNTPSLHYSTITRTQGLLYSNLALPFNELDDI